MREIYFFFNAQSLNPLFLLRETGQGVFLEGFWMLILEMLNVKKAASLRNATADKQKLRSRMSGG